MSTGAAEVVHHRTGHLSGYGLASLLALVIFLFAEKAQPQEISLPRTCAPSVFVDSSAGIVTVRAANSHPFVVSRNLRLCPGDEVTTGPNGRVAIRFEESRTVIRLGRNSRMHVRASTPSNAGVRLLEGLLYFISSVRTRFTVETPYIVAGIEGTEALAGVSGDREIVAVREGVVGAYDRTIGADRTLSVPAGAAAFRSNDIRFDSAPIDSLPPQFRELLIVSDSAVDWAVYYPPIMFIERPADRADASLKQAIEDLSSGDYEGAIAALDQARSLAPARTAALRTIIAIARNRLEEARSFSTLALEANPDSAPAHVAASYVDQAVGDLDGALDRAYDAALIGPDDAYVMARLAELQMIVGDRPNAVKSTRWSADIGPTALALFVEGLARLAAWEYAPAERLFEDAIDLDQESPLPRLGLGLAFIRQGKTAAGAWQLELAVAHDPKRASLRTWLGRAYYDEGLDHKAVEQFDVAKQDDPEDPTPYLFSALERYAANDPIGALRELEGAEERGGARSVLRSERGLGEDTATVGAALGRVFDVLGFSQLAINQGARAIDADPANPGAHRFMSDAYRQVPGAEIAQTSELLRSQLLSPPSSTPVQPELAEARLALLDTTGPSRVTFAEFSPLFDSDGLRLDASGLYGTQETWGDEAAVTGLYRGFSLSVGQYHYETDGYHENNDLSHDIYDAVTTIALSPEFSIFGEYRNRETNGGDLQLNFNGKFDENLDAEFEHETARVGFHAQLSANSDLIGVYTWADLYAKDTTKIGFFDFTGIGKNNSDSIQMQYIRDDGILRSVAGAAYIHNDINTTTVCFFCLGSEDSETEYYNGYVYFDVDLSKQLTVTAGGSVSGYQRDDGEIDIIQFDPKLGLTANLNEYVTLRAAYFRNVKPDYVSDQLIEPTTIAGFNQFFDAINGSVLEEVAGGIDIRVMGSLWIGAEAIERWWDVPVIGATDAETVEQIYRGYAYMTLSDRLALSTGIVHETSTSDYVFDFDSWRTTSVPVTLSYFSNSGLFGSIGIEFVDHEFSEGADEGHDQFAPVNAILGYRLPRGAGVFTIEVQNLFDEDFQFQNRTLRRSLTAAPRYAPERTVLARGTIHF